MSGVTNEYENVSALGDDFLWMKFRRPVDIRKVFTKTLNSREVQEAIYNIHTSKWDYSGAAIRYLKEGCKESKKYDSLLRKYKDLLKELADCKVYSGVFRDPSTSSNYIDRDLGLYISSLRSNENTLIDEEVQFLKKARTRACRHCNKRIKMERIHNKNYQICPHCHRSDPLRSIAFAKKFDSVNRKINKREISILSLGYEIMKASPYLYYVQITTPECECEH